MPSDLFLKSVNRVHETLFRLTKGRIGGHMAGMDAVALTTTGRKSGRARTTMLTSPLRDGERVILIASKGGADVHPDWYLNLRDQPLVEVAVGTDPAVTMRARTAEGEERAQLWERVVSAQPRYGGYQSKTERLIPVVVLEPA